MTCKECINNEWCCSQKRNITNPHTSVETICCGFKATNQYLKPLYYVGQTIHVVRYGEYEKFKIQDIRYIPAGCIENCGDCQKEHCVFSVRYWVDNQRIDCELIYVYDKLYDDCYETFTEKDVGNTIFFTEEDANKKLESLSDVTE